MFPLRIRTYLKLVSERELKSRLSFIYASTVSERNLQQKVCPVSLSSTDKQAPPPIVQSYHDHLNLDSILCAQKTLTNAHDEMLFIIQHQTTELWMKLVIHELSQVRKDLEINQLQRVFKTLSRVARIFDQLNGAWEVLRTMTPSDYTEFRSTLGSASGIQSYQYRMIEYMLGNRDLNNLKIHEKNEENYEILVAELDRLSIYDHAVRILFTVLDGSEHQLPDPQMRQPRQPDKNIQDRWQKVYENPSKYWELYELAEKLVDLEDYFRRWRFNHVTTVERVIGNKTGTGGSSGVPFLSNRLKVVLFPELWRVRGDL